MASRREFLTHTCGLGVATATVGSTLMSLAWAREAAANHHEGDYKALVCILLGGGNDSYNMLLPHESEQLAEYEAIRADLALDTSTLLSLPTANDGRNYALHPGMADVMGLYLSGEAAFINNVGTLIEAVDSAESIELGRARVPVGLYSHRDQISQWQTAISHSRNATQGWVGRLADIQGPTLANGISMNISLSGSNVLQSGNLATPYSIHNDGDGAPGIFAYDTDPNYGQTRKRMIDDLFAVEHTNLLKREYSKRMVTAIDNQQVFIQAMRTAPEIQTMFDDNYFARGLRQIARVIGMREAMGAKRQTFFVNLGGWDHHDEVLNNQARMLPWVSRGLKNFRDALVEIGAFNDVLTFTISDFGRTLTSNGRGSDHGWGGHHIVMGGPVNGGRMFGTYPTLSKSSPLDTGRGVYIPTTSTEEYFTELALWFGVQRRDLDVVLPNVREFYSPESPELPLGVINI